jgi:hypothetical protein
MTRKDHILRVFYDGDFDGPSDSMGRPGITIGEARLRLRDTDLHKYHPNALFAIVDELPMVAFSRKLVAVWRKSDEMVFRLKLKKGVLVDPPEKVIVEPVGKNPCAEIPIPETPKRKVLYRGVKQTP